MIVAAPEPKAELQPMGEQRVVLRGLSWEAYLQILDALPQSRGSRLTYDDGVLEITVPLEAHEFSGRLIECFIRTLVELMGLRMKTMGSTTMNYPHLKKGAEPDNAYYIQNQPLVKGREVDFTQDPPPDLVVEVDITHTDIAKNQFYSQHWSPGVLAIQWQSLADLSASGRGLCGSRGESHISSGAEGAAVCVSEAGERR